MKNRKDKIIFTIAYFVFAISPLVFLATLLIYLGSKKEEMIALSCITLFVMIYSGFICHSIRTKNLKKEIEKIKNLK